MSFKVKQVKKCAEFICTFCTKVHIFAQPGDKNALHIKYARLA